MAGKRGGAPGRRRGREDADERSEAGYRIGTVSTLTGLDAHTIRAWERRYGAIAPSRSQGGTRSYSDGDVLRLQLIKAACDYGDSVGSVARLSDQELRERLARLAGIPGGVERAREGTVGSRAQRLAVVGPALHEQLRSAALPGFEVATSAPGLADLDGAPEAGSVDVLVMACDALGREPLATLERARELTRPGLALVVYDFARRSLLEQLAAAGAKLVRGPLSTPELRRVLADNLALESARQLRPSAAPPVPAAPGDEAPPRRFDDGQLARLTELRGGVECECPNHLSSIVRSLVAFERYSFDCETSNQQDRDLHARLGHGTGRARALLEQLLTEICDYDGIRV